jgi:two-component system response regulator MtrA
VTASASGATQVASTSVDQRVLLVEDDETLRGAIALVLRSTGMHVHEISDGHAAIDAFDPLATDVVVLDVNLPGIDGFEVCQTLRRRSNVPVVMMTARDHPADIVRGLEIGADDYVVKPFEAAVLLARIRAVLRRSLPEEEHVVEHGEVRVDVGAHRAWRGTAELDLSATEFRLLTELVRHAGQVLTRAVLLERVWGYDYLGDSRLVDMAIKRLRDKLGDPSTAPELVTTVRGVGYRFERT